jgi:hypothetical protein
LILGDVASMKALAKREGVTQRYIAHLLKLAWLAPDVIQAINAGTFPAHITLEQLKKGIPLEWKAQREAFGLSAKTRQANRLSNLETFAPLGASCDPVSRPQNGFSRPAFPRNRLNSCVLC